MRPLSALRWCSRLITLAGLGVPLLWHQPVAPAGQEELLPPLFEVQPLSSSAATASGGAVHRLGRLNARALQALQEARGIRRLPLSPGNEAILRVQQQEELEEHSPGFPCYAGTVEGVANSQVVLVGGDNLWAGTVLAPGRGITQIKPLDDGLCELSELDPADMPICAVTGRAPDSPEGGGAAVRFAPPVEKGARGVGKQELEVPAANEREIELMVAYTRAARQAAWGTDALEVLLRVAVAEANAAFAASDTGVRLRLVHTAEVNDAESGDLFTDLARLRSTNDGIMDEVHAQRDESGADLVCLIVEQSSRYEGIASFPTGPESGFCVLDRFHLTGYGLLAHEIGHNLGCDHDLENATGGGAFEYSFGHRFEAEGELYRTVMCYAPGWPIGHFSNPAVFFKEVATGIAAGEPNASDNARTIREMASLVDSYRGLTVTLSLPGPARVFEAGSPLELAAEVLSQEGAVTQVEFLNGSTTVGEVADPPYRLTWTPSEAGKHTLTARARLNGGAGARSAPIVVGVRPENDNFARRQALSGSNLTTETVLYAATTEPGEPNPFGSQGVTAWWTWSSPSAGTVRVTAVGIPRPKVAVFTGAALPDLKLVAKAASSLTELMFQAIPGEEYRILVQSEPTETTVALYLTMHDPPPNDDFADALEIRTVPASIRATTLGATRQPDEPAIGTTPSGHSIWYTFTPPAAGQARLSLVSNLEASADLAVFTGDELSRLELLATSAQAASGFTAREQAVYRVAIDAPYGDVTLNVSLAAPPPNDSFARRSPLNPGASLMLNNSGAGVEAGEPQHGNITGGRSQWWSWRAPTDGGIRFTRTAAGFSLNGPPPVTVAVYEGTQLSNLVRLAAHDFVGSFEESLVLPVRRGTNYCFAMDGPAGSDSRSNLRFEFRARPTSDHFAQRQPVPPTLRVAGTTLGATAEKGEPGHGGQPAQHSVWHTTTYRTNGTIVATISGSGDVPPRLSVYTGTLLTNLVLVADNAAGGQTAPSVEFAVEANRPYHLAVDESISRFSYTLTATYVTPPGNDNFTNRVLIPSLSLFVPGTTLGTGWEEGEPEYFGSAVPSHSIWYSWTARTRGRVTALAGARMPLPSLGFPDVSATLPDPLVVVFTGSSLPELVPVAQGLGSARFEAERNVSYSIAVVSRTGLTGDLQLMVSNIPSNDAFRNSHLLTESASGLAVSSLQLRAATLEPGEPDHGGHGHSLWWSWTARRSGSYVLSSRSSFHPYAAPLRLVQALYTGRDVADLTLVARGAGSDLVFSASAGTTYHLALDSAHSQVGLASPLQTGVVLSLSRAPACLPPKLHQGETIEFAIEGGAGERLTLEASLDLADWLPVRTFVMPATGYRFYETRLGTVIQRFYRVVAAPAP